MGTFKLGEIGEYIPQIVKENTFLNDKLENDTYGIYYSVKFDGDAETFLLQAKKAPVEGQAEWGHIEKSKSGKSMRFKRDKKEESVAAINHKAPYKDNSKDITLGLVYKTVVAVQGIASTPNEINELKKTIKLHAQMLYELSAEFSGPQGRGEAQISPPEAKETKSSSAAAPSLAEAWKNTVGPPPIDGDEPYNNGLSDWRETQDEGNV